MAAAAATASGNCQCRIRARCATRPTHNATRIGAPMAASGRPDSRTSRRRWPAAARCASSATPATNALTHDSSAEVLICASKAERPIASISGTINRSAAGLRGATKYVANPASASNQCTISHADTRSSRTISAPTQTPPSRWRPSASGCRASAAVATASARR